MRLAYETKDPARQNRELIRRARKALLETPEGRFTLAVILEDCGIFTPTTDPQAVGRTNYAKTLLFDRLGLRYADLPHLEFVEAIARISINLERDLPPLEATKEAPNASS